MTAEWWFAFFGAPGAIIAMAVGMVLGSRWRARTSTAARAKEARTP